MPGHAQVQDTACVTLRETGESLYRDSSDTPSADSICIDTMWVTAYGEHRFRVAVPMA
jgi:hypothetical protein